MQNKVKKLSEMITAYLDKIGLFEQSTVLEVYTAWSRIVGEKQAAHSKLIDIKHHTAIIGTDHAGWSQQILLNKRYILYNFQKKYPQLEVKNISVIVSSQYNSSLSLKNSIAQKQKTKYTDKAQPLQYTGQKRESKESVSQKTRLEPIVKPVTPLPPHIQEVFERLQLAIKRNK